ncbi:hypothetical protein EV188_11297 [Actinomycetospora succinea]|uniref:Uncharacterized protein n=1 Tax=Actinomycetospora succinea TaxID=663603 RepID=A0A4V6PWQ6_9PSEU|nr:hypothetical protein [Actinomycetospora succinea]TDQ47827.1 hypothetical protein EV188_11297 [Actinomycetospora succinea]
MDSVPPVHGPARDLDDVLADLGADDDGPDDDAAPPPDLPEVVEAVTGRARDLHRLADRLSAEQGSEDSLSAVALLRAHAGAVGDLAEHLQAAGDEQDAGQTSQQTAADPGTATPLPATTGADAPGPDDDPAPAGADGSGAEDPQGVPRHVG